MGRVAQPAPVDWECGMEAGRAASESELYGGKHLQKTCFFFFTLSRD